MKRKMDRAAEPSERRAGKNGMPANSRQRFRDTMAFSTRCAPPRYESEFYDEAVESWSGRGLLEGQTVEAYFHLDRRENLPFDTRCAGRRRPADGTAGLARFRRAYDPASLRRVPADWPELLRRWRRRDYALSASPWSEGFLQVIGVSDWASFRTAMLHLYEKPRRIEAVMEHYADFLEALLDGVPAGLGVDYAIFYEAIASNQSTVIAPQTYARFAVPALRRVIGTLRRRGVTHCFAWTTGQVKRLVPLWLEAGIDGMVLTQTAASGLSYMDLRREFGRRIRLMGGLDWRAVMRGRRTIDNLLRRTARPLLEQGGYIPHLDDRIRPYLPFENYRYYRMQLNALMNDVYGPPD
ncbi:MAG: hypothetical protein M1457_03730 [bacterium]|nr:hypothetical protein [bacterium]